MRTCDADCLRKQARAGPRCVCGSVGLQPRVTRTLQESAPGCDPSGNMLSC